MPPPCPPLPPYGITIFYIIPPLLGRIHRTHEERQGQRRSLGWPGVEAQSIQGSGLEMDKWTDSGRVEWGGGGHSGPGGWSEEQPQGGDRVMGPLSSCLIMVSISWGSMTVLSCRILFRPVLQAGISSPGSAGALWGPLQGTPEAEGTGRAEKAEALETGAVIREAPSSSLHPTWASGYSGEAGRHGPCLGGWEPWEGGPTLKNKL